MKEEKPKQKDHRILGLITIGWISIALFIFTIPLAAILKDSEPFALTLLPLAVIGGAIASGILLWSKGGPKEEVKAPPSTQIETLEETIHQLEERLQSLETMSSYEQKTAERNWTERIVMDTPKSNEEEGSSSNAINS